MISLKLTNPILDSFRDTESQSLKLKNIKKNKITIVWFLLICHTQTKDDKVVLTLYISERLKVKNYQKIIFKLILKLPEKYF